MFERKIEKELKLWKESLALKRKAFVLKGLRQVGKTKSITEFAKNFGLAFQICDDILDEISSFEIMGKTIGKDKKNSKLTYVSLYGLDNAKCKFKGLIDECYGIIEKYNSKIFTEILDKLNNRIFGDEE